MWRCVQNKKCITELEINRLQDTSSNLPINSINIKKTHGKV